MTDDWDSSKSTFMNDEYINLNIEVIFEETDDPSQSIYESDKVPPALVNHSVTSTGDVDRNATRQKNMAEVASGTEVVPDVSPSIPQNTPQKPDQREQLANYLDADKLSYGTSGSDIGKAPDPTLQFELPKQQKAFIKYYSGCDIYVPSQRLAWQKKVLQKNAKGSTSASVRLDQLPKHYAVEQKAALLKAGFDRERLVSSGDFEPGDEGENLTIEERKKQEEEYYSLRTAFSGSSKQLGPEVNVCLNLLLAEEMPSGRYKCHLLSSMTDCEFYHYQISGAVGVVLKLNGTINVDKLLNSCVTKPNEADQARVRGAASALSDLRIHRAILPDDVGFGKTKQSLLAALLHVMIYDITDLKTEVPTVFFKPILLVLPPALINQWVHEIRDHRPMFELIMSYDDHNFAATMSMSSLTHSDMKAFSNTFSMKEQVKAVFNQSNPAPVWSINITSYDTHKQRSGVREKVVSQESSTGKKRQ